MNTRQGGADPGDGLPSPDPLTPQRSPQKKKEKLQNIKANNHESKGKANKKADHYRVISEPLMNSSNCHNSGASPKHGARK